MSATDRPQNDKSIAASNADIHIVGFNAGDLLVGPDRDLARRILNDHPRVFAQKDGEVKVQSPDGTKSFTVKPDGHGHLLIENEVGLKPVETKQANVAASKVGQNASETNRTANAVDESGKHSPEFHLSDVPKATKVTTNLLATGAADDLVNHPWRVARPLVISVGVAVAAPFVAPEVTAAAAAAGVAIGVHKLAQEVEGPMGPVVEAYSSGNVPTELMVGTNVAGAGLALVQKVGHFRQNVKTVTVGNPSSPNTAKARMELKQAGATGLEFAAAAAGGPAKEAGAEAAAAVVGLGDKMAADVWAGMANAATGGLRPAYASATTGEADAVATNTATTGSVARTAEAGAATGGLSYMSDTKKPVDLPAPSDANSTHAGSSVKSESPSEHSAPASVPEQTQASAQAGGPELAKVYDDSTVKAATRRLFDSDCLGDFRAQINTLTKEQGPEAGIEHARLVEQLSRSSGKRAAIDFVHTLHAHPDLLEMRQHFNEKDFLDLVAVTQKISDFYGPTDAPLFLRQVENLRQDSGIEKAMQFVHDEGNGFPNEVMDNSERYVLYTTDNGTKVRIDIKTTADQHHLTLKEAHSQIEARIAQGDNPLTAVENWKKNLLAMN